MIIHQFLAIKDISLLFESGLANGRLIFLDIIFPISFSDIFLSDIFFPVLFFRYFRKKI